MGCDVFKMKIVFRFFMCGGIVLCPLEFYLHKFVQDNPNLANAHNVQDESRHTDFFPVEGCKMPPSQPLGVQAAANSIKLTIGMLILGTLPDHFSNSHDEWDADECQQKVSTFTRWTFIGMSVYQLVMVPISMALMLWHFFADSGPFRSHWHAYSCYAALMTSGPWWFNGLMFMSKWFMSNQRLCGMRRWHPAYQGRSGRSPNFSQLLTDEPGEVDMEEHKVAALGWTFVLTVAPYTLLMFPVFLTHLIPAAILYLPEVAIMCGIAVGIFWFTAVNFQGQGIMLHFFPRLNARWGHPHRPNEPGNMFMEAMTLAESTGGLMLLPILIGANIIVEVLIYQAIYFYHGDGFTNSVFEVFSERQSSIYFANFRIKVMSAWWSATDMVNEVS